MQSHVVNPKLQFKALPRLFYYRSAEVVAHQLIGCWLIRNTEAGPCGGPIVETEAYLRDDPACHAAPGPTDRNRVMFGEPGHSYVYFIYGCHFCVNAVCCPPGTGEAVLIRAVEPLLGEEIMRQRRNVQGHQNLTNGPGKLAQAMDITRALNGVDLCDPTGTLFIGRNSQLARFVKERGPLVTTPRIGITRAASLPLRFLLAGSHFVSRRHKG